MKLGAVTDAPRGGAAILRDLDRLESEAEGNEAQEGEMPSPVPGELQPLAPVDAGGCQARKHLCPGGSWAPGGQGDRE